MKYDNVNSDQVGERLYRGRILQGVVVGIKLENISPGTMTIASILENFPHVISVSIFEGVSMNVVGNLRNMTNVSCLHVPESFFYSMEYLPPHLCRFDIILSRKNLARTISRHLEKLVRRHGRHVVVKINDHTMIEDDLLTSISNLDISIGFHKT